MDDRLKRFYEFGPFRVDTRERILLRAGIQIALTPKAFDTLCVLIQNSGHVLMKDELMKRIWPDSFVEEATLAQNIFTLRKILGESPDEHQYIETVPKRGYRFIARVKSWDDVSAEPGAGQAPAPAPSLRSLAVLPFRPLGPESDDEYFGLGMADALITKLSNIRKIIVRPTSAVARYTNPTQEPAAIGRELKVEMVLEGRIQRVQERVRVTVQLVNVENSAPLWAKKFDGEFVDIFGVQDEISSQVVEALTLELSSNEMKLLTKHHTTNAAAYQQNLKGRYQWNRWTEEGFRKSIEYFKQAIEIEPDYAQAYAGIADTYNALAFYSHIPPHEAMPKVKEAAERALHIDDTLAEAHLSLASVLMFYDWQWQAAEREFKKAIELNPSYPMAHQGYGLFLIAMGRFEEAKAAHARALELDPISPLLITTAGFPFYFAGQYDEAIEQYKISLEVEPNFGLTHASLGDAYTHKGMYEEAVLEYERGMVLFGRKVSFLTSLGHVYGLSGNVAAARQILEEIQALAETRYVSPLSIAIVHIGLGEKDAAFDWLQKSFDERSNRLVYLNVQPTFNPIRSDSRFKRLLARVGLI
ncbi:MAG TPA: winged helix-turn-helix domain-containing protein [Blastocatellia bacterium]|nr:winged helix-turn-helix domain-containing protein [Blastocatellia bacterium]